MWQQFLFHRGAHDAVRRDPEDASTTPACATSAIQSDAALRAVFTLSAKAKGLRAA